MSKLGALAQLSLQKTHFFQDAIHGPGRYEITHSDRVAILPGAAQRRNFFLMFFRKKNKKNKKNKQKKKKIDMRLF